MEDKITAKVSKLSELEGAAANNSEAVSTQRDELEVLRKNAGELEMQRHRLDGEKEQIEITRFSHVSLTYAMFFQAF